MKQTMVITSTKEISYVLLGEQKQGIWLAKLAWKQLGCESSVLFDGQKALAREESRGDLVGFYHTHPEGFLEPSKRDDDTMSAWSFCFGKPLLCAIATRAGLRAWVYDSGGSAPAPWRGEVELVEIFKPKMLVAVCKSSKLSSNNPGRE